MFKVYSQDSFCFPGCLPEGGGPDSNGDTFDTREEAVEDAIRMLKATLDSDYSGHNGKRMPKPATFKIMAAELRTLGETSVDLPYIDPDAEPRRDQRGRFLSNVSPDGSRFVSFSVVDLDAQEDEREARKENHASTDA